MSSIIKKEETPDTFLRAILRTPTLPPAEFPDAASTYNEKEVEPPVLLQNTMFLNLHFASRGTSTSTNSAYQGSSPHKYRLDGGPHSRDLCFPEFAQKNAAPQPELEPTMVENELNDNLFNDGEGYEQVIQQPPNLQLQLDGTWKQRSTAEEIYDLVVAQRAVVQDISTLKDQMAKIEMEAISTRAIVDQLAQGSMSTPETPTKSDYKPFQTFMLSNPGREDEQAHATKVISSSKSSKKKMKPVKTQARKELQVKIPDVKNPTISLPMIGMGSPSNQPDSGYLTGNLVNAFPNSPLTPGRIGPATPSKRSGNSTTSRRKNIQTKGKMAPSLIVVPHVPLTDTEIIVYMFQSLSRPAVALRLYSRGWGPALIVNALNAHRDIEGGYLRNTCSVKCTTAIARGKDKHGKAWVDQFNLAIEHADDLVATDMIRYANDELASVVDYDIRALGNGLKEHPEEGVDGGIFTRCVKYCIEWDVECSLSNVHGLAWALQTGSLTERVIGPETGEEGVEQTEDGV